MGRPWGGGGHLAVLLRHLGEVVEEHVLWLEKIEQIVSGFPLARPTKADGGAVMQISYSSSPGGGKAPDTGRCLLGIPA
jgi:hypothetical protein